MRGRRDLPNDEQPPPAPQPWEQGEGGSFGSWLRQQREIRNISLREIADNTKIGMRYLEALEDDRFEVLPAPIFAKGFLREFAKYVGLDADEVVNFYIAADQRRRLDLDETEPVGQRPPMRSPPGDGLANTVPWLVGVVVALLLAGLVVWLLLRARGDGTAAERAPAPPIAAPVAPPPPPASATATTRPAAPADGLLVHLTFTAECWVEAVIDGERRIEELHVAGESMQITAQDSVLLTLGNAGAVRVDLNGRALPVDASPGQVVRDLLIDRSTAGLPPAGNAAGDRRPTR